MRKFQNYIETCLVTGENIQSLAGRVLYNKFYTNATLPLSKEDAKLLADAIMNLGNISLNEFMKLI